MRPRDDTPVGTIRPYTRGELASLDDLVDMDDLDDGADPTTGRRRRRRRRSVVLRVVVLVLVAMVAYYGLSLYQVWSVGRSDQAQPVDAIVVMGAAQYDGTPSPLLAARLDHAAALFAAGIAPVVVVTGGKHPDDRFTEAEASARYLRDAGVPESAIVLENEGRTSYESLVGVGDIARAAGYQRVLIVTDPFHSLRSRLIAEGEGLVAYVSPTPTSIVSGPSELRHMLVEAGGVSVGRLFGFARI